MFFDRPMRAAIAELQSICADPARNPGLRRIAQRCLQLCLRAEAANDGAARDLLQDEVNELLRLIQQLRAASARVAGPGAR
jgi:hypothetical protein